MRPTARRIALVVIVALLVAVHYARQPSPRGSRSRAAPPAAATSAPEQLRVGTLLLHRCEVGRRGVGGAGTVDAFCSAFDVPEDWDSPAGRHIQLRVAVVRSAANPDLLNVTYNCGDGIHPSPLGYFQMGKSVDLDLFGTK